jgi:hypothetical protein
VRVQVVGLAAAIVALLSRHLIAHTQQQQVIRCLSSYILSLTI